MDKHIEADKYKSKAFFKPSNNSIIKYARSLRMVPNNIMFSNNYGTALKTIQKYDAAIHVYKNTTIIDPKYLLPYYNWSEVLYKQGKVSETFNVCELAYKAHPSYDLLIFWGRIFEEEKRYDEAAAKYREAINFNPKKIAGYDNLQRVYVLQEKFEEAIEQYKLILEVDQRNFGTYLDWGKVLYDQYKYQEAIIKFNEAIDIYDGSLVLYLYRSLALQQKENSTEAKEDYIERLKISPNGQKKILFKFLTKDIEKYKKRLSTATSEDQIKHCKQTIEVINYVLEMLNQEQITTKLA